MLEGLDASVVRLSEVLSDNATHRLDSDYFSPAAVRAFDLLRGGPVLGDYVRHGYRVVYENTKLIERDEGDTLGLPYFLQAADIETPFINEVGMGCVPESEWARYPKGRIDPGELLIEVKGLAEKVAVVHETIPRRTLVTGTCFKLTTHQPWQRSLLLAFLLSRPGRVLKNRLKTNLLVAYIAKGDLYRLPLPRFGDRLNEQVHRTIESALGARADIVRCQDAASDCLIRALALPAAAAPPLTYTRSASDALSAQRLDATYFSPAKQAMLDALDALPGAPLGERFASIRNMFNPDAPGAITRVRDYDLPDALQPVLDDSKAPEPVSAIGSLKKRLRTDDVVISRLRAYLKEVAVVRAPEDIPAVGSSEFIVLRRRPEAPNISPETLLAFLRSDAVQTVLKYCQDGSQHPRFSEADLLAIPLPDAVVAASPEITREVQTAFDARRRARRLLDAAVRAVEIAIEDGEAVALSWLNGQVVAIGLGKSMLP